MDFRSWSDSDHADSFAYGNNCGGNIRTQTNVLPEPYEDSTDTIATIVEIVFGLFGMLGMGWVYVKKLPIGLAIFLGYFALVLFEAVFVFATLGLASCFILPLNIAVSVISGFRVRDYVRKSGAQGSLPLLIVFLVIGAVFICSVLIFMSAMGIAFLSMPTYQ